MGSDVPGDAAAREDAALRIQRAWRKNATRPSNTLSADARWEDAAAHAKLQVRTFAIQAVFGSLTIERL